jgi:hypothetical protein
MRKKIKELRQETQQFIRVADRTADNKVAVALLAYACELEQRAKLIENAKGVSGLIEGRANQAPG